MGYTTEFAGRFKLDRPLTDAQRAYLKAFNETRRMKRVPKLTERRADPLREAVGLPVGVEGEYFVGEGGYAGQNKGPDVDNGNYPPSTQPGLWCQWTPSGCGNYIQWDQGEKFYNYHEWLSYIIQKFLKPWGYTLNGEVAFQGESRSDSGKIYVIGNVVKSSLSPLDHLAIANLPGWETAEIPVSAYCWED